MCYICRCFGWILDLLQRILTFLLACIMSCAICIGLTLAVGAGIAYGYNWSLAEFLTFKRADVTVYVRRGQFADRPEVRPGSRRSGADGDDYLPDGNELFSSNYTADYQEHNKVPSDDSKPLSDAWQKAQDSRAYADKLTKYSKIKTAVRAYPRAEEDEMVTRLKQPKEPPDDDFSFDNEDTQRDNDYSIKTPTLSSIMDNEPTRENLASTNPRTLHIYTSTESETKETAINPALLHNTDLKKNRRKNFRKPDIKIEVADDSKSLYLQPHYNISKYPNRDYSEDLDYMYKPV